MALVRAIAQRRPRLRLVVMAVMAAALAAAGSAQAANGPRRPRLMAGKHTVYQRVIARPGATIHPRPDQADARPVLGFSVFYVYDTSEDGAWVEVGRSASGNTEGWIDKDHLIKWNHTIVAAFTNPAGRGLTLIFRRKEDLLALLHSPDPGAEAARLRRDAVAGRPGPVIALEPARYVDISHNFYLFPVLAAQEVRTLRGTTKVLELVAAREDQQRPAESEASALQRLRAGVVFVVDTTKSTQPYIDRTREAIAKIVRQIAASPMKDNFRFGLIGYRDSLSDDPRLEYTTRWFAKPDFSKPPEAILPKIADISAATVSSNSFDEDAIAGIKAAIEGFDWGPLAGRYIVLVTDAGARGPEHPHSTTPLNITGIKSIARAKHVVPIVIHLRTPAGRATHDHQRAEAQYRMLTHSDQAGVGDLYYPVAGGAPADFAREVDELAQTLLRLTAEQAGHHAVAPGPPESPEGARMERQLRVIAEALRLAYLGRTGQERAPDFIHGFAADTDFADPTARTLELRVLLTKNQLADLGNSLGTLVREGTAGVDGQDEQQLFDRLRAALAGAQRDPQRITQLTHAPENRFADLLPDFIDGLPYRSPLLNISEDDWNAMGPIAQREKLSEIETKVRLYQEYASQRDLWTDLGSTIPPGETMFPVPINDLP